MANARCHVRLVMGPLYRKLNYPEKRRLLNCPKQTLPQSSLGRWSVGPSTDTG